ncbi:MAG: 50S ribosomal protein L11 methyltransferase, partial [Sphingobacteriia bacterium]|nr:50S ribosomal protein L11 methyltransferase [Sphingobacteriia bacterium]
TEGQADIIVANIIADIIIMVMPDIPGKLKPQGLFLTSGIIAERKADVIAAAKKQGLVLKDCKERGGWVALVLGKEE